MTSEDQPVFQTPNPTELQAAKKEPSEIEKKAESEAEVNPDQTTDDGNMGRETAVEMGKSQITTSNISGH